MTDNRFENLSLLAPEKHSNAIADPTDTIPHVGVLGWVEQVCKRAIRRMRWNLETRPPRTSAPRPQTEPDEERRDRVEVCDGDADMVEASCV
jgi:hypothetical protein